jgi:hypothetical protein
VVSGIARVDRRTKRLLPRLQPGDIAVIDHEDIDRVSAEGLIQRGGERGPLELGPLSESRPPASVLRRNSAA